MHAVLIQVCSQSRRGSRSFDWTNKMNWMLCSM